MRIWLLTFAAGFAAGAGAQDWPQWRGPARDGAVSGFEAPAAWPETLTPVWTADVGTGYATPLLVDGNLFQFARWGEDEVLYAMDPETGEVQSALLSAGPAYMINAHISEEQKQIAWDYLQLAHGKAFSRILADQTGAGHRISVLTDSELVAKWPHLTANYEAAKVGIGRPAEPWWPEAENAIGRALQEVAAGGDAASLMMDANSDIREIVEDAGYYDEGLTYVSVEQREEFVCAKFAELGLDHDECM